MVTQKLVENIFFFGLLLGSAYLVWQLFAPFMGAIALAAIIVTVCYPFHEHIVLKTVRSNATIASLISVFLVIGIVVIPLLLLGSLLLREAVSVYSLFNSSSQSVFMSSLTSFEAFVRGFIPEFSLDIGSMVEQSASFVASHLLSIFAGTASTLFFILISLIALFYFFRDGKTVVAYMVRLSPLNDGEDRRIIARIATAIRSVTSGTLLVALIQGILTSIGLAFFGFQHAILWGSLAAVSALIPGVGTTIIFVPAVIYLIVSGSHIAAGGLALWAVFAVGLIDNFLGPYLMSRGNALHPFATLLSVLGGISLFGPIGFIVGPVITSLFVVLVELYASYLKS